MTLGGMRSQALPVASPQTEDGNQDGGGLLFQDAEQAGAGGPLVSGINHTNARSSQLSPVQSDCAPRAHTLSQ